MFLINGQIMSKDSHPSEYKWYLDKLGEIKNDGRQAFRFKAFHKRALMQRSDGRMIPQRDRNRLTPMIGTVVDAIGIPQEWAYAKSTSAITPEGDGFKLKRINKELHHETVFDINHDIDLIFFFKYIYSGRNVKEVDERAQVRQEAEHAALESKAKMLIFNPDSPIHPDVVGSDSVIKNIAIAWGVPNVQHMDVYAVMGALWAAVERSDKDKHHTGRGFDEFIKDVFKQGDGNKRSTVAIAISKGILKYDGGVWKMFTKGGMEQFLCAVPPGEENVKDEYVMKYLLDSDRWYATVEIAVQSSEDAPPVLKKELGISDARKILKDTYGYEWADLMKKRKPEIMNLLEAEQSK